MTGTSKPKTGSVRNSTCCSSPESTAESSPRVALIGMRLPLAERAARPAGVDEPHRRAVLVELLAEQLRVHGRRLRQERRAEARRERRLRLGDADLGAGELRREAGEEEEERLLAAEARDRRQDPERVGREEDDVARMAGALRREHVRDALELVRGARVLGLRVVVEVELAALVDRDVLEDGAEAVHGVPDLRLGLGREADRLRVAAALEVEDAVVAPAVLVVADELARRIGGKRRLAGAGEPEEDRDVLPVLRDVRGAVHRRDALERQPVVHHGEDRLLDLAAVERAADDHLAAASGGGRRRPRCACRPSQGRPRLRARGG